MLTLAVASASACSPFYVIRAGWEEAGILMRREQISSIVKDPKTDAEVRRKLNLVLQARDFSKSVGLKPDKSFTQYSAIDREVLVWVLSASEKTSLTPVTWWFPIVGSVPYKGFFSKDSAIELLEELKKEEKDVYLRPSAAFSTLGWFNDPLLSTMIRYNDISLVNTVFHEVTHNTVWYPNHVPFNETLASVVGALATIQFFEHLDGEQSERAKTARSVWNDERIYSEYLQEVFLELEKFYAEHQELQSAENEILQKRKQVIDKLLTRWGHYQPRLQTKRFLKVDAYLNNAVLLAQKAYYDRTSLFGELFRKSDRKVEQFLAQIQTIIDTSVEKKIDPFVILDEVVRK